MAQSRTIRLASSRFRFSPSRVVAPRETSRLASTLRALAKRRVVYLRRRALTSERASRRASERKSQKLSSVCLRGGPESLAGQQSRLWTLLAAPPLLPVELFALYLAKNWRASLQSASGRPDARVPRVWARDERPSIGRRIIIIIINSPVVGLPASRRPLALEKTRSRGWRA